MRQSLEVAICLMMQDVLGKMENQRSSKCNLSEFTSQDHKTIQTKRIAFVAKSLGSRFLFDTLSPVDQLDSIMDEMLTEGTDKKKEIIKKTVLTKKAIAANISDVYLLANQLPLLGLGRIKAGSIDNLKLRDRIYCDLIGQEGGCKIASMAVTEGYKTRSANAYDISSFAADSRAALELKPRIINIYAFHDPADILGYKAGQHFAESAKKSVNFIDITHRNSFQWLWVFANPMSAHAKEDMHESASKIIWCGGFVGKNGAVNPSRCK